MNHSPPKSGPLEMADLPHVTLFKRKTRKSFWQYRRHIPVALRFHFKHKAEFFRTLTGDWSGKLTTEQVAEWTAANDEFNAIAKGEGSRLLAATIIPRANNANAPPLSANAVKINAALAKIPRSGPREIEHDEPLTVADAVKRFTDDPLRAATEKTKDAHAPRLDTLVSLLASDDSDEPKYIASVTRDDMRHAVTMLNRLPREHARGYAELSPAEAIEQGAKKNADKLSAKTIGNYIETWRSFFSWCEEEDLIAANPAKTLKAPAVKRNQARRDAWKSPALTALFSTALHQDALQRVAHPGAFWVPLIALFQGMRLSEIVMLSEPDVKDIDGVWCFLPREREDHTIKNETSAGRTVPIHQTLLDLGIIEHVRSLPAGAMLWPDLMTGKRGKLLNDPADMYGKRDFVALMKAVNITEPGHVFHALRHRFSTACRAARIPDSVRHYLGGWAETEGVASSYGGHEDKAALKADLDRVTYPGVTLPPKG